MSKTFKLALENGQESATDEVWVDTAGKAWPIYRKKIAIAALANAGTVQIAHGIAAIKLNGLLRVHSLQASNAGNTQRTTLYSSAITNIVFDADSVDITNTGDLSLHLGSIEIEYNKTTD